MTKDNYRHPPVSGRAEKALATSHSTAVVANTIGERRDVVEHTNLEQAKQHVISINPPPRIPAFGLKNAVLQSIGSYNGHPPTSLLGISSYTYSSWI
jgi:hypothetical protein